MQYVLILLLEFVKQKLRNGLMHRCNLIVPKFKEKALIIFVTIDVLVTILFFNYVSLPVMLSFINKNTIYSFFFLFSLYISELKDQFVSSLLRSCNVFDSILSRIVFAVIRIGFQIIA